MKYKLIIDCDDVLLDLNGRVLQVFNEENGTDYTEDIFTDFDIYKCLPFELAEKYTALWLREDIWRSLSPVYHAQWGMKKLIDDGFEVFVATSTHYSNFAWKIELLQAYFPFIDSSRIICIGDKSLLHGDIMVDDCTANLISNLYCHRICLEKSWNQNVHDEVYGIHRCKTWDEIIDTIQKFYKEDQELMKE